MIYSAWGCKLKLTAYCGKHKAGSAATAAVLVRAQREDDGAVRHYFAYTLSADGGGREIDAAVDTLPEISLAGDALKSALAEAE